MTGLEAMWRGLSLITESTSARRTMAALKVAERFLVVPGPVSWWGASGASRVDEGLITDSFSELSDEMLDDGAERQHGQVGEADDEDGDAGQHQGEQRRAGGQGPPGHRDPLLAAQRAGDGQDRDHQGEPADQHADALRGVVPVGVATETGEGRAVVVGGRGVGVDDLGETVGPRVV